MAGVVFSAFALEVVAFGRPQFLLFVSIILVLLSLMFFVGRKTRVPHIFGALAFLCQFLLGGLLIVSVSDHLYPDAIKTEEDATEPSSFLIRIVDQPQEKKKSVKVVAQLANLNVEMNGKVLLYFGKDSLSQQLEYGQILAISTKLDRVKGMGNPNEFDYARYLRFHNILYRGYVKNDEWQLLSQGKWSPTRWFLGIRAQLVQKLKKARLGANELSVASALILGYRADLDKELMSAYAGAGATHVLAVSGLHVGIVYIILNGLLKFLDRNRKTRIVKTLLLVMLLFGYAGLTGLSASVFRAATMFSFVAIGKAMNRNTNIFNTLAASAFCLILYNPMIVMQVGFQLSYLAVMGIVLIQPRLLNLMFVENRLGAWAWSITCVSVAAQLATFPLGLLYFHQFPNLFLLSNLLVIPAAAVILYLGFSLFIFSFWEPTLLFFGFILNQIIGLLNRVVSWIENIPHSVLSGIDISIIESLLIYGAIGGVLYFVILKKIIGLRFALILAVFFVSFQVIEVSQQKNQKFITLYNVRGETAIALIKGKEVTFLSSKEMWQDEQRMLFHVRHHWWKIGIEKENFVELGSTLLNRPILWNDVRFSILDLSIHTTKDVRVDSVKVLDFSVVHGLKWNRCQDLSKIDTKRLYISNRTGFNTAEKLERILIDTEVYRLKQNGASSIYTPTK